MAPIKPAVDKAWELIPTPRDVLLKAAITGGVWQAMDDMLRQAIIQEAVKKTTRLQMVGDLYDIDSRQVQWLGPHPEQERAGWEAKRGQASPGRKGRKARKSEE